ncbi:16S rRNA (guanine(966)-N(2))-methyltransferase RsmD [Enterovibrio coralii]|uniref:Ribosomal RNA small subunit methyltransferase D n=1 Tax=Enterovibrio coralii TaxID=294935 RepID=A0A135IB52_9GAMM|nr:16S rRNA (guanine(966)-N(2))-methyltransferase RsmD [Enterovibrio coralii]KXF82687.1 16S rRNA (guanine(966)-N(2))-methyltransferase RsmD [Enterovibrio coralii]
MVRRNPKNPVKQSGGRGHQSSANTGGGSGFVRIISGKWRGRKLPVKNVEGLRPTTDRVKETVFNWLAADLYDAKCLDVFAGSGGLGLEALSRQAEHVTLLELDKGAAAQINLNLAALKADNATVKNVDALQFLGQPGQAFDVVFIDPPFRKDLLNDVIDKLENNGWLSANAIIYIEAEKEFGLPVVPNHWDMIKEKHAGQVSFRLYQREEK